MLVDSKSAIRYFLTEMFATHPPIIRNAIRDEKKKKNRQTYEMIPCKGVLWKTYPPRSSDMDSDGSPQSCMMENHEKEDLRVKITKIAMKLEHTS